MLEDEKAVSREIQQAKKNFFFAGGLSLDDRAVIDRSDAVAGQQGREPLRLRRSS